MNDIKSSAIKGIILKILAGLAGAALLFAGGYFGASAFLKYNNTKAVAQADTEDSGTESVKETEFDTQAADEETVEVEHPEYAAYADILNDSSHEEFAMLQHPPLRMRGDDDYLLTGLCFAKLIDMDGNGVDELIIVDGNGIQFTDDSQLKDILTMQIWSYEDGEAQQLYEGKTLSGSYMDLGVCIMQRGDYYYVEVGNEETYSEYDLSVLGYENGSFGTVMEVETEVVMESYKVNGETMSGDEFISYFHSWPDYEEKYDFFYNKNYITTCEEPASDNYCEYYYTCDPEVFQEMLNDVKSTCNAKAVTEHRILNKFF